ncbi:MAG: thiamine phosphate synthase [Kiritimatiellae bacterium]|nr:thiamine phosphate synthase [Kiritimatiellia bacterium]
MSCTTSNPRTFSADGRRRSLVVDLSLYLVTDRALCRGRSLAEVVAAAVAGGVSVVQLREKDLPTRAFIEEARHLKTLLAPKGVPLIINDRVDVAWAAEADGVHLGQSDMTVADARRLLGPRALIGLSIEKRSQVDEADAGEADYLAASPVFSTPTKTDTAPALGLEGVAFLRGKTPRPLVAIGGVNLANAAEVIGAGADGLAVVSAICSAADPEAAARALKAAVTDGLALRDAGGRTR